MLSNPHSSRLLTLAAAAGLFFAAGAASASSVTYTGELSDCAGNAALVGPGADPSPANCLNDSASVNNVALYTFNVGTAGNVQFESFGAGVDTNADFSPDVINLWFTLFSGTGVGASFVLSNLGVAGDFNITQSLGVGDYTVAIGALSNVSMAEFDPGNGLTLGRGFNGGGVPLNSDSPNFGYEVKVTTPDGAGGSLPEPASGALALAALAAAWVAGQRRRSSV